MLRFIARRLLQLIPILFGLSVLLFIWLRSLPGGPGRALLGERATAEDIEAINEQLGLNDSLFVQYGRFLGRVFRFDFGTSIQTGRPVTTEFLQRFPGTIELTAFAIVFAVAVGIPLGYLAARRHGGILDLSLIHISEPTRPY